MKTDLHIHTCFSDGGEGLQSIFDELKKQDVQIASITDHNNIDAYKHLDMVNKHNIKIIYGMEVDVEFEGTIYHILMYRFNKNAEFLKMYLNKSRKYEIAQFKDMIFKLEQKFNLKLNSVTIEKFIKCNQYFDKVKLNNLLCEMKLVETPSEAFYNYTKEISDKKRYVINANEFFKIAKDCNAITSLAHPIKYLKALDSLERLKEVIIKLKSLGLNGIEVYNNRQDKNLEEDMLIFANEQNLLITGGSDYHSKIGCVETKILGKCLNDNLTTEKLSKFFDILKI